MYLKDKTEGMYIRLSKKQMAYLTSISKTMGISKTELLRGYLDKLIGARATNEHYQTN